VPLRKTSGFFQPPEAVWSARNEMPGMLAFSSVVSGVLICASQIFINFGANRRNCWLCIVNEFWRLPLVLALFSSN
jgi:hypothetical protein